MKKKAKRILLALAVVAVMVPVIAWVGFRVWARHAGSWAVTGLMSDEQLIAICQEALECKQGEVPEHAGAAVVRMQDIDPKLATEAHLHLARISTPAATTGSERFGLKEPAEDLDYPGLLQVRDETGLRYEYYDESEPEPEPYVDSWEITENMSNEELIAIVEEVIQCEQGAIPDHAFAAIVRMEDIDPELATEATIHLAEISTPATAPEPQEDVPSAQNDESELSEHLRGLFGVYVRDGNGGHYEYYDFDKAELASEPEIENEPVQTEDEQIAPQNASDVQQIVDPKVNKETSTTCYIFAKKGRQSFSGTGFFLNDTVVCTAAHVIYSQNWSAPIDSNIYGWADEVYIVQAFMPDAEEPNREQKMKPYGQLYAQSGQMAVGADWKPSDTNSRPYRDDADWGVFPIKGSRGGSYPALTRTKITPKTYYPKNIHFYGYPGADTMLRINGRTAAKPTNLNTYRVLYPTNSTGGPGNGVSGMSGGPTLDTNGNVIGIFLGLEDKASPRRSKILGMDGDLYNFLSRYK